jgi:hypothetical protein
MKKWLIIGVLAAGLLLSALFIPYEAQYQVKVRGEVTRVVEQISVTENLPRWMYPFTELKKDALKSGGTGAPALRSTTTEDKIDIAFVTPFSASVDYSKGGKPVRFFYSFLPSEQEKGFTIVNVSYKKSLFNQLFPATGYNDYGVKSLNNLKSYIEDPLQLYGYDIKVTTVKDTSFLVKQITVKKEELADKADALFAELIAFAEKNNGNFTGVKIFHRERITKDEYDISAGIGVTKSFPVLAGNGIEYKMMPLGKNLLITTYTGLYGDIDKAYEAIDQFKKDNALSSMAISFEKIPDGVTRLSDSEMVRLEICYPIF